jgi:demethylmenaquinone methyltransferase/2-methoxy-6-polyprenyl-1,4-benzoquinol methylase
MFGYIYMKILESHPRRYDRGINWLSFGHADSIKRKIVEDHVKEGIYILEIGVGTGSFSIQAAQKGATVLGFDISPGMLKVAKEKVINQGLQSKIQLKEIGVAQMDGLPDSCFDLVVGILVFSELSPDEIAYTLQHAHRVLKNNGKLVIADETRPRGLLKRLFYQLIRLPLLLLTYILTQTTTSWVDNIDKTVIGSGFRIQHLKRSAMDTFFYLQATKED